MTNVFIFVLTELTITLSIFLAPIGYWSIAIAALPLLLLCFATKPTLRTSQNTFAAAFSVAFGILAVGAAYGLNSGRSFYNVDDIVFFGAYFAVLICFAAVFSLIVGKFARKHFLLFFFGTLFAVAQCCIPQNSLVLCAVAFGLTALSAGFYCSAAVVLNKRLKEAAVVLGEKNVAPRLLARNTAVISTAVNMLFVLFGLFTNENVCHTVGFVANIVCAVASVVFMFYYLRQPLNYVAEQKIALLRSQPDDVDLQRVKEYLYHRVNDEKLYIPAAMLKEILDVFMKMKVVGLEKATENSTLFVANHYEIYGPMISVLKFPKAMRPWTDSLMTNRNMLARQLTSGINVVTRKWVIKPIRQKLPKLIATPMWKTLNYGRPVSIYRRDPQKIEMMFRETIDALRTGDSIFIFPEKTPPGEHYKLGGVDKFQTGFVEIADRYYKETGIELNFYPIYIDKKGKKMTVGEAMKFDGKAEIHEEKTRLAEGLYEEMKEMSEHRKK